MLSGMGDGRRGIGAVARESGLSVSALRFYDSVGVLRPAYVDPVTGYRWYNAAQVDQARLIAVLRRVRMSVSDICEVLEVRHEPPAATRLLDQHLRKLEDGLADARRQLDVARDCLQLQGNPMTTLVLNGGDLSDALAAVRFAMSNDPELPALCGVLFDFEGGTLRLVASDRYRLAIATVVPLNYEGPAVQMIVPRSLVDDCALERDETVFIRLDRRTVWIGEQNSAGIDAMFPDYQRLLPPASAREVTVTAADLLDRLVSGPTRTLTRAPGDVPHDVSVMLLADDDASIGVIEHDHPDAVAFNREFLLEAIDAGGASQLVLGLDGPISPLVIRDLGRPDDLSLLMPTRLP
jgi:DNA polymerase-3 subunit beta